ncbi:methylated-DNA--[protein]-cysteine S-methyltransferase [soil metagenome]
MPIYFTYTNSPIGRLELQATDEGLTAVKFMFPEDVVQPEVEPNHPTLLATVQQLKEYFAGDRKVFDVPLAPQGSDFQKRVWHELVNIPWGTTTSYLHMAEKLGSRLTIRAVGGANGKNPIGVIIPCHRVIGANGNLTGYAGGLWRKQWLLELEGMANQLKMEF